MKKSTLTLIAVGVGALATVAGVVAYKMCNKETKCLCGCKTKKTTETSKEETKEEVITTEEVAEEDVVAVETEVATEDKTVEITE